MISYIVFGILSTADLENCIDSSSPDLSNGKTFKLANFSSSLGMNSTEPRRNDGENLKPSGSTKRWGTA